MLIKEKMKVNPIFLTINLAIWIVSLVIALPAINYGGASFNLISEVNRYTGLGLKEFDFANSKDFMEHQIFRLNFNDINTNADLSKEEKEQAFVRNYNALNERLEVVNPVDYEIRKVVNNKGEYFAEVVLPKDSTDYSFIISAISSPGQVQIYKDIEDYEIPEDDEAAQAQFDFLDGKELSTVLTLEDVIRVRHYYEPALQMGTGEQGGYVVRLDFGDDNVNNLTELALDTQSSGNADQLKGIWLVQAGFPIGVQAEPIFIQPGAPGQSYVLFTSLGSSSYEYTKALASIVSTVPIESQIVIEEQINVAPAFDGEVIDSLKIVIPLSILASMVLLVLWYGRKGILVSSLIFTQVLAGVALSKFLNTYLNAAFIAGMIVSIVSFIFSLFYLLKTETGKRWLEDKFSGFRKSYWIAVLLLLALLITWAIYLPDNLLNSVYGFLIFTLAGILAIEVTFPAITPLILKQDK